MSADQLLAHGLEACALFIGELEEADLLARVDLRMLADQVIGLGFGLGRKGVVGGPHIGKLGVAAGGGNAARAQQRVLRRNNFERGVRMPESVPESEQPESIVPRQ